MKFISKFFFFVILSLAFICCKNEAKRTVEKTENYQEKSTVVPVPEKKVLSAELEEEVNSVMLKSMVTPELKTFSSMLVTANLADMLLKKDGPFTLIGPSNDAFDRLGKLQMEELLNTANEDELVRLIKSHVIDDSLDSATLVRKINEGNGSYRIVSMSGATYSATLEGTTIVITDVNGVAAQLEKSDINGVNGVVHVLDKVLAVN